MVCHIFATSNHIYIYHVLKVNMKVSNYERDGLNTTYENIEELGVESKGKLRRKK